MKRRPFTGERQDFGAGAPRRGPARAGALTRALLALLSCLLSFGVLLGMDPPAGAGAGAGLGFVEVCKAADGDGVTGTFVFEVADRTVEVPVGSCSPALQVPAGEVKVVERPRPGVTVTGIATWPADRLVRLDLPGREATVRVVAGDVSTETIVTFSNRFDAGVVKVCKVAGSGVTEGRR